MSVDREATRSSSRVPPQESAASHSEATVESDGGRSAGTGADHSEARWRELASMEQFLLISRSESNTIGPEASPKEAAIPNVEGYEILRELGRGGMGVVYLAVQRGANRPVALKMLRQGHGGDVTSGEAARFRTEVEAAAAVQHPNIAQLFEVGEHQGSPYFSLELCEGGSLAQRLARATLHDREAASLLLPLTRAMEAAHQQGVIHRDLKPGNILLAGGGPDVALANLIPKVADFGLARKIHEVGQTQTGAVLGTPSYMAPEQADGRIEAHGPATDLYALGAILYECLTGRPPFKAATAFETVMMVLRDDPMPPRKLVPGMSRDLETICLKCLEKDPSRRYESATALADDLSHFLRGEPIRARPVGPLERAWKWSRRHPAWTAANVVSVLLIVTVLSAGLIMLENAEQRAGYLQNLDDAKARLDAADEKLLEADQKLAFTNEAIGDRTKQLAALQQEREAIEQRLSQTKSRLYASDMIVAGRAWQDGRIMHLREILNNHPDAADNWEHRYLRRVLTGYTRLEGHAATVYHGTFSPDGSQIVTASTDRTVRFWDTKTNLPTAETTPTNRMPIGKSPAIGLLSSFLTGNLPVHPEAVHLVVFEPDGTKLYALSTVCTIGAGYRWDLKTKAKTVIAPRLVGHGFQACVALSRDCKRLARGRQTKTAEAVSVVDLANPEAIRDIHVKSPAQRVAFSRDASRVAATVVDGPTFVWDAVTGEQLHELNHSETAFGLAFSVEGQHLLTGSDDGAVHVWNLKDGTVKHLPRAHQERIVSIEFSPDGTKFATSSLDRQVKLWDFATLKLLRRYRGHDSQVHHVAFSPDGLYLLSSSQDGSAILWDTRRSQDQTDVVETKSRSLAFQDSARLALDSNGEIVIRNLVQRTTDSRVAFEDTHGRLELSRNGSWLVVPFEDRFHLFDVVRGREVGRVFEKEIRSVAVSDDGTVAATFASNCVLKTWDSSLRLLASAAREHADLRLESPAFVKGGSLLATIATPRQIILWDPKTATPQKSLRPPTLRTVQSYAFDSGAKHVVVGSSDYSLSCLDVATDKLCWSAKTAVWSSCLAFDHADRRIAIGGYDGSIGLWDAERGHELLVFESFTPTKFASIMWIDFSPDDRLIAGYLPAPIGELRILDAGPGKQGK